MRRLLFFALIPLLFVAAGCAEPEPEPPPEDAPPPPPTSQELYQKLRQPLQPLWAAVQNDQGMNRAQMSQAVESFRQARQQVAAEVNSKDAIEMLKRDLSEAIPKGRSEERGKAVWLATNAWNILEPGSTRYASQEEWASLVMQRPEVAVKGFMGDGDNVYAFVEVTDPDTRVVTNYQVREGEEFHEVLRFLDVVGDKSGIRVEYKPLEQTWEVLSPSQKRRRATED